MNEGNIIETILGIMKDAEQFVDKSGLDKKRMVLDGLKRALGSESYERYFYFVTVFIDFVVEVSKGRKIALNDVPKCYCW